jgi:hypothetical protein
VQDPRETSSPTESSSSMKFIFNFFLFFGHYSACLDPDPDPKHCLKAK